MASEIKNELRDNVERYLSGDLKLHEFEDRFAPLLWEAGESGNSELEELAGSVHILLAEYSAGDRTLQSLREQLAAASRGAVPSFGPAFDEKGPGKHDHR